MATAGTLLSDLDSKTPVINNDDDLVNKILAEMNSPGAGNPVMSGGNALPPAPSGRVINSPNPNTVYPQAIDPGTATAHMIGKDYPTASDFANLMHPAAGSFANGGSAFAPANMMPYQPQHQPVLINTVKENMYSGIVSQMRQPLLVAIIIFIVSLPIINVLVGHYLPSLLRSGGDLTTAGMAVKALFGGFLFWFIQRILVPLMAI